MLIFIMKKQDREIKQDAHALLQMYQSGFLDGFKFGTKTRKRDVWDYIKKDVVKAFNKRYIDKKENGSNTRQKAKKRN